VVVVVLVVVVIVVVVVTHYSLHQIICAYVWLKLYSNIFHYGLKRISA